jgi:hypothetical protein
MSSHPCTCGETHHVKDARKEVLNRMKLTMLRRAADHVIKTMDNNFMVREICEPDEFQLFNNFQKLRYHGLVTPVRDANGKRVKGIWLITRNGWDFLRGSKSLHAWVRVKDNRIIERSEELVTLREVAADIFEIVTRFEYFDESTGEPVGLRPGVPAEQASLL